MSKQYYRGVPDSFLNHGIDSATVHYDKCEYTGKDLWHVKGHGEYEDSSVLAGSYRRVHLDTFDTEAEARAAYPWADGGDQPVPELPDNPMPLTAPGWFDPADAGEAWGEDDY